MQPNEENALKKEMADDYNLIPLSKIEDEARLLALEWCKYLPGIGLADKQKMASDFMNYARRKNNSNNAT